MRNIRKKVIAIVALTTMTATYIPVNVFAAKISSELPKYELMKPEMPEAPKLEKPEISMDFERPQNFPDINMDLNESKDKLQSDLNDKGFGKNNFEGGLPKLEISNEYKTAEDYFGSVFSSSIKDKPIASEWSSQGIKNKLSDKEFKNYLINAEKKYLPKIEAAKKASSKIDYKPISLKGKFNLMSYDKAKKQLKSLPSYNKLKSQVQSSKNTKPKPLPKLSYTGSSKYNAIKNKVESSKGQKYPSLNLPAGVTMNSNGQLIDNRGQSNNIDSLKNSLNSIKNSIVEKSKQDKKEAMNKAIEQQKKNNVNSGYGNMYSKYSMH